VSKRLEFSRKTRQAIAARAAGHCERCKAVLKTGEGEYDDILPCALGGEPTVANGRLICRRCHKDKTTADVRSLRHGDRMRDKHSGVVKQGGKFPARSKASKVASDKIPVPGPRALFKPAEERT